MSHEIHASLTVRLPDEPMAQAQVAQTVTAAWRQFLEALKLPEGLLEAAELRIGPGRRVPVVVVRRRGRPRKHAGNGDALAAADEFQRQAGVS
jgi:hypothetical protein